MQRTFNHKWIVVALLCMVLSIASYYLYHLSSRPPRRAPGWQVSTPEKQGMRSELLVKMIEIIRDNSYNIDGIVVVRNGRMVLEAYFYPYSQSLPHIIHSGTKSIMSALIGIALEKGFIKDIDQPVMDIFPDTSVANIDGQKNDYTSTCADDGIRLKIPGLIPVPVGGTI